jgi:DNA anti-recombination protein RmuC
VLIGILFGIASGIAALIIIASVTLRRFEVARHVEPARIHRALADLQASSERAEHTVRHDIDAARRELETATRELRDESAVSARALREAQERHLGALAAELRSLADTAGARLEDVRALLEERLRQIQAESRDSLDQLRADATNDAKVLRNDMLESLQAHTDAKLDSIVEQRLGESFSVVGERLELVSERLEQVHRGLGEVQTFAAGLDNIQRALANVRRGASKTRGGPAPAPEAEPLPRTARRKPTTMPADVGHGTDDAPGASSV